MKLLIKLTFSILFLKLVISSENNDKFPEDFLFGVASSSYQIEGGWNEGGKSFSIWDNIFHKENINKQGRCWNVDCSDADVTADSYHNYERDVEMMKELGVQLYRFSISWPRILPSGFPDKINEEGVHYYNNLIDLLIANNITPMVTIYHWELPQSLQDLGGWANPMIVDWFSNYARMVIKLFGDRVKLWTTINEPLIFCQFGYGDNVIAPAVKSYGIGGYICFKNSLLAHAKVWHMYDEEFRHEQNGQIGININMMWYPPLTDSEEDVEAAKDMRAFEDWAAHAIFSKEGDYPERMKQRIAKRSKEQGFPNSRLPELSKDDIEYIRGTANFFGLNAYATYAVNRNGTLPGYSDHHGSDYNVLLGKYSIPSYADDINVTIAIKDEYKPSLWMTDHPPGFYNLLKYVNEQYQNPVIYVTENGICTLPTLEDDVRVNFLRGHLHVLKQAITEGVDVRGYAFWSLMDSFEWNSGYTIKFGLYEVDFDDPKKTRVPKSSAKFYRDIIKLRAVPEDVSSDKIEL